MEERSFTMKKYKLNRQEKSIEKALMQGEYHSVSQKEFKAIAQAIVRRKKDAILNIRVNSQDLKQIKQKSKQLGIPYQTLISELFHRLAA